MVGGGRGGGRGELCPRVGLTLTYVIDKNRTSDDFKIPLSFANSLVRMADLVGGLGLALGLRVMINVRFRFRPVGGGLYYSNPLLDPPLLKIITLITHNVVLSLTHFG